MLQTIRHLLYKEFLLEWKQKYAFNGLLLYVLSMVVVISLAFIGKWQKPIWIIMYWLLMLFIAINAVAKSFLNERQGQHLYTYTLASPQAVFLAKLIYNFLLLSVMGTLSLWAFAFLAGMDMVSPGWMSLTVILGALVISANLTMVTAIAARAENRNTLLAVLSFPLIVPVLLILIDLSRFAVEGRASGINTATAYDQVYLLLGLGTILTGVSLILFPFVWRE
ncbi:MAG: heme exporter protein CcmB [Bacteroidota bacterium]